MVSVTVETGSHIISNRIGDDMAVVRYQCTKCGEIDKGKFFKARVTTDGKLEQAETAPPMINCYNCHAGMRMDIAQMIQTGVGMKRMKEEVENA